MTLIGYWPMIETGGDVLDHSGSENHGTPQGITRGVPGILGQPAFDFDGVDDVFTITEVDYSEPSYVLEDATFSIWMSADPDTSGTAMRKRTTEDNYNFSLNANGTNENTSVRFYDGSDWNEVVMDIQVNTWYHVVATIDKQADTISGYLNGVFQGEDSIPSYTDTSTNGFHVGGYSPTSSSMYTGKFAEFRLYDRVLAPSEIQYLYDVGSQATLTTEVKTDDS